MSNLEIVTAASEPAFYMRVCYAALKAAQAVAAEPAGKHKNYANRIAYANRVFQGSDNAILLAQHVATNPKVAEMLQSYGADGPSDKDIEATLTSIWDVRANAFAALSPAPPDTEWTDIE